MARNKFDVDERLESPFRWKHLKRAGKYIARHKYKMLAALLLSAMASVASLFIPKITQWVLDEAVPNKDTAMIGRMALLFVGIIALGIVFTTIRSRMMAHVSQRIIHDIRSDLFAHLQKLPFSYYDSRPAGKILVRVINYVNSVSDILSNGIINMILEIINLIFIVVFMFSTNTTLALVIIAGLPFFIGIIILIKPRQRRAWQNQSNKNSNYNAYLAESIDGVRHHGTAGQCLPGSMAACHQNQQHRLAFQRNHDSAGADLPLHRRRLLDGRRKDGFLRRNPGHGTVCQPLLAAHHQPGKYL